LFFRFHTRSRLIVLGWVNDTDTKRAYGSKTDAYRVFQSMLASGHPPDDWDVLLQESAPAAKHVVDGGARLLVEDDDLEGAVVMAVLLSPGGRVIAQRGTVVGGEA